MQAGGRGQTAMIAGAQSTMRKVAVRPRVKDRFTHRRVASGDNLGFRVSGSEPFRERLDGSMAEC